jgi:hypothetical protein
MASATIPVAAPFTRVPPFVILLLPFVIILLLPFFVILLLPFLLSR